MPENAMTLADFLLARIAEDEAVARAAADDEDNNWAAYEWAYEGIGAPWSGDPPQNGYETDTTRHMTRWNTSRALAECEAKRRIVEWAVAYHERRLEEPNDQWLQGAADAYEDAMKVVALPYADHPDYRDDWRP